MIYRGKVRMTNDDHSTTLGTGRVPGAWARANAPTMAPPKKQKDDKDWGTFPERCTMYAMLTGYVMSCTSCTSSPVAVSRSLARA